MYPAVHYNNRYFLFAACFISAAFIVLFDQEVTFFQAWTYPSFYPALGGSMVISGILIGFIHWMTTRLDKRYPWDMIVRRSTYQFLFGLAIPGALAFVLAAIYFRMFNHSILEPECEYLKVDYPVIILLLMILNMYYIIHYHIILIQSKSLQQENGEPLPYEFETDEDIDIQIKVHVHYQTLEEVDCDALYYFRKSNTNWMCSKDGEIFHVSFYLTRVETSCPPDYYVRINKQVMIRFDSFEGFRPGPKKCSLQLLGLKPDCIHEELGLTEEYFSVSEKYIVQFKEWYARLHPQK